MFAPAVKSRENSRCFGNTGRLPTGPAGSRAHFRVFQVTSCHDRTLAGSLRSGYTPIAHDAIHPYGALGGSPASRRRLDIVAPAGYVTSNGQEEDARAPRERDADRTKMGAGGGGKKRTRIENKLGQGRNMRRAY